MNAGQLSLLDVPRTGGRVRATDPETSAIAAVRLVGRCVENEVQRAHREHAAGLTDDELCSLLPERYAPTVKSARSRLSNDGVLCDSGLRRDSQRGRPQIVWVWTPDRAPWSWRPVSTVQVQNEAV